MQKIDHMTPLFKYHNIMVNGQETVPGRPFYNDSPSCERITHFLCRRYEWHERSKIHIADLGPLEGGHAAELVRYGFQVTCIEGRPENCEKLEWLKNQLHLKMGRMTVVCDDAWNVTQYGPFDVVLCAGLLYHLDRPAEFLKLISGQAKDTLILSTHYSDLNDSRYEVSPLVNRIQRRLYKTVPFLFNRRYHGLSPVGKNEGHWGRWLQEFPKGRDPKALLASALTNHRSFWLTKGTLQELLSQNGFRVMEFLDNPKDAVAVWIGVKQ
jgi:hypothetical protein